MIALDTDVYSDKEREHETLFIRDAYASLSKRKKSALLSYLHKAYDLVPATMVVKFNGRNKFNNLEIRAVSSVIRRFEELWHES